MLYLKTSHLSNMANKTWKQVTGVTVGKCYW